MTAPVQKSVINDAGVAFTGHTEYLAARDAAMLEMLYGGALRVSEIVGVGVEDLRREAADGGEALGERGGGAVADDDPARAKVPVPLVEPRALWFRSSAAPAGSADVA